ncbi:hypothetical protein POTOM_056562 [Populus tomentosa]|uniref:Uncharacterized protein n=1 Tax=Populus tomentosa TaxID=118781 RepID=A0A8X7Y355_POPTO|nr:hypothetical protein POTOM_056562 [Populus tomentosa]
MLILKGLFSLSLPLIGTRFWMRRMMKMRWERRGKENKTFLQSDSSSVKGFLSSIPAPRNSATLGVASLGSGYGRRSVIETDGSTSISGSGVDQSNESCENNDVGFDQNGEDYVNHDSYEDHRTTGCTFFQDQQVLKIPASSKGKPSKLQKRKHQKGSLYFDIKQNWQSGVPEGSSIKMKRTPGMDGDIEIVFSVVSNSWC